MQNRVKKGKENIYARTLRVDFSHSNFCKFRQTSFNAFHDIQNTSEIAFKSTMGEILSDGVEVLGMHSHFLAVIAP